MIVFFFLLLAFEKSWATAPSGEKGLNYSGCVSLADRERTDCCVFLDNNDMEIRKHKP